MKMHWNVTYNDPNRWNEVYAICGTQWSWRQGIRQAWSGQPLGSPKLDLLQVKGIIELQAMRDELNHRTPINFLRTTKGVIAFTKVRLEVYAIPIEESELQRLEVMGNQEERGTSTRRDPQEGRTQSTTSSQRARECQRAPPGHLQRPCSPPHSQSNRSAPQGSRRLGRCASNARRCRGG